MKKLVLSLLFTLTIGITAGCGTMPVGNSPEESGVGDRSAVSIMESTESEMTKALEVTDVPELTSEPEATDVSEVTQELMPTATPKPTTTPIPTVTPKPTATPKPTPTQAPVIDQNVVERDAYAVNGKNGKIHKTGKCSATGDGKNAMKDPEYFPTYEEAEARSEEIDSELENRKCGICW